MMRLWSFLCTFVVSFFVLGLVGSYFVPSIRLIPAEILVKDDRPRKGADAIVLLMGDAMDRAPHAAQLLRNGFAKKIVFVEAESDELMRLGLKKLEGQLVYEYLTGPLGVASERIVFSKETRVSSTFEEARAILALLEKNRFDENILATSWYHSSRAAWIFKKVLDETRQRTLLESYPSALPASWYAKERDFLSVFNEYLKWIFYYVRYDLLAD